MQRPDGCCAIFKLRVYPHDKRGAGADAQTEQRGVLRSVRRRFAMALRWVWRSVMNTWRVATNNPPVTTNAEFADHGGQFPLVGTNGDSEGVFRTLWGVYAVQGVADSPALGAAQCNEHMACRNKPLVLLTTAAGYTCGS